MWYKIACMFYFARCMNIIFNSLLVLCIKYDVHTTSKIKFIDAICYHILLLYVGGMCMRRAVSVSCNWFCDWCCVCSTRFASAVSSTRTTVSTSSSHSTDLFLDLIRSTLYCLSFHCRRCCKCVWNWYVSLVLLNLLYWQVLKMRHCTKAITLMALVHRFAVKPCTLPECRTVLCSDCRVYF